MSEFRLRSAEIIRRRYDGQEEDVEAGGRYDVLTAIVEINLFESIFKPYMTGSIAMVDSSAFSSIINFQGQEIINLQWSVGDKEFNRSFYIYGVKSQDKSQSGTTSTLVLGIIERHGYLSKFMRMDGSRAGNVSSIIGSIFNDMGVTKFASENAHQSMRIMENNRTPIEIIQWLTDRATGATGEPMFVYATMPVDDEDRFAPNVKMRSLGTMLNDHPWEDDEVFRYTSVSGDAFPRFERDNLLIWNVNMLEHDDVMVLADRGALHSTYINIDPFTRSVDYTDFNAQTHFENKKQNGSNIYEYPMFDFNFRIDSNDDSLTVANMPSTYVSGVNVSGAFADYPAYNEEPNVSDQVMRISRESDLSMLEREVMDVHIWGYHIAVGDSERGVGTTIALAVPKDQPSYTPSANVEDKKRSGRFLIKSIRHQMNNINNDYYTICRVARTDSPDPINSRDRNEQRPT